MSGHRGTFSQVARCTFVAALLILVGCKAKAPPPGPPPGPPTPELYVNAGDLLKVFGGNAIAAESKYKGKVLAVTGKFGSVQKAPLLGYVVQLLPEDAPDVNLTAVQCPLVEAEKDAVGKMQEGQIVTFIGTCEGQAVGQVKMSKCWVGKTPPRPKAPAPASPAGPPTPEIYVKAGDLISHFAANAITAENNYKGKVLAVTGKFGSVQKAPLLGYVVQLLPEDMPDLILVAVQCPLVEAARDDVGKMKEGQVITMIGTCDGQVLGQIKMSNCWVDKNPPPAARR